MVSLSLLQNYLFTCCTGSNTEEEQETQVSGSSGQQNTTATTASSDSHSYSAEEDDQEDPPTPGGVPNARNLADLLINARRDLGDVIRTPAGRTTTATTGKKHPLIL